MSQALVVIRKYPLLRGVLSYSIIWPTSAFIQQKIAGKSNDEIDWGRCARFFIYGGFYVAPTLYTWIKISSRLFPRSNFRTAIFKSILEQLSYTPFAMTSFYFFMSILEGREIGEATDEVKTKFVPTYKAAMCIWPLVSTINFALIPEKNRVPFISACSLLWTCFLAYMKQLDAEKVKEIIQ